MVERMTGAAPRVEQQTVMGEAQVLQVFEMQDRKAGKPTAVAGCRVSEGSIRAACTYRVLRDGETVSARTLSLSLSPLSLSRFGRVTDCKQVA